MSFLTIIAHLVLCLKWCMQVTLYRSEGLSGARYATDQVCVCVGFCVRVTENLLPVLCTSQSSNPTASPHTGLIGL